MVPKHEKGFPIIKLNVVFLLILLFLPLPVAWAGPVPDTGLTKCYNDTVEIPCPAPGQPFYGQDAQYQGPTRSYTKIGQNGVVLADTTTQESGWLMTRDNVTGLVWEMKTGDGTIHNGSKIFTWCDNNPATNGGNQGTCGTGTGSAATDTEAFIKALNDAQFGGFNNWRLPTIMELSSLVNSSIRSPGPTIDTAWFPRTVSFYYWSSTTNAYYTLYAWHVVFSNGGVGNNGTKVGQYFNVRAVRSEQ
jgi:hypothetical protein